jgi:hypothetical protein
MRHHRLGLVLRDGGFCNNTESNRLQQLPGAADRSGCPRSGAGYMDPLHMHRSLYPPFRGWILQGQHGCAGTCPKASSVTDRKRSRVRSVILDHGDAGFLWVYYKIR